jgi:hypothetical protein
MKNAERQDWDRLSRPAADACPSEDILLAWVESGNEDEAVETHLARCDSCCEVVEELRIVCRSSLETVPSRLVEAIHQQVESDLPARGRVFTLMRPAVAVAAVLLVALVIWLTDSGDPGQSGQAPTPPVAKRANGAFWVGGPRHDTANSCAIAADGTVLTVGSTQSYEESHHAIVLSRFDLDGAPIYTKIVVTGHGCTANGIDRVGDDLFVISGSREEVHEDGVDAVLIAINSAGDVQWVTALGGAGDDQFSQVAAADDGSIYAVGISVARMRRNDRMEIETGPRSYREPHYRADFVTKLTPDGTAQWTTWYSSVPEFPGMFPAGIHPAIAVDAEGVWITSTLEDENGRDGLLSRIDLQGNLLWQRVYDAGALEAFEQIRVLSDGSVVVGGYTHSDIRAALNLWITRISPDGGVSNSYAIYNEDSTQCRGLAVDSDDRITVAATRIDAENLRVAPVDRNFQAFLFQETETEPRARIVPIGEFHQSQFQEIRRADNGSWVAAGWVHTGRNSWDALIVAFEDAGEVGQAYAVEADAVTPTVRDMAVVPVSGPTVTSSFEFSLIDKDPISGSERK